MAYVSLPAARVPGNAMLDFRPLVQTIGANRAEQRQNAMDVRNARREDQADARAAESHGWQRDTHQAQRRQRAIESMAGVAQSIMESPAEMQAQRYQQFRAAIPDFDADMTAAGFDPNNWQATLPAIVAKSRGYQDPLDREYKQAQINKMNRDATTGGETPSNVREWKYFSQLSPEQQQQYLTMKRAEKYLDTGTEFTRPNPVVPGQNVSTIPKNVADEEAEKKRGQTRAQREAELPGETQRLGMVTGALDRLEKTATDLALSPGLGSVAGGLYQTYAPNVFEDARNAGTELENLKVKISGVVLQSMRDMSKTGGAVGQVTEREWPRLENMLANLDPRQGIKQFRTNLQEIVNYTQAVKAQLRAAYEAEFSSTQGYQQPGGSDASSMSDDDLKRALGIE